jgi:AAA ATPase domain/AAA domain, putative AbiEii toxin, Type IV TA system
MTALIKSLSLKNFKGFSDEVRIELRPITLLFGANSAGKSSVLHALQYVREILDRNNANVDRTAQGGEAIDLGGFMNLVHGRSSERQIEIAVEMALGDSSIPELVPDVFDDWQIQDQGVWNFYDSLQQIRNKVERVSVRLTVGWNSLREEPIVMGYEIGTNGAWCVRLEASGDGRDTRMRINRENSIFMEMAPDADAMLAELDDWVNPRDLEAEDPETADEANPKAEPSEVLPGPSRGAGVPMAERSVLPDLFFVVQEAGLERPGDGLRAWLTGFNGALPKLGEMLYIPAPGAKGAANIYIAREFTAFLSWLTIGPAMLLRDQLRHLRYLGPLRKIPPRGFEVSLTKSDAAWSDGMAAWETLMTGPQSLVDACSEWMSGADKLGTGYSLSRRQLQEFDLSTPEPSPVGHRRPRIALIDAVGLAHQAQDIGVGISQVLPVVVAAQDAAASVVCIEQPELHVHPAVQVGLGDLFIDGSLNKGLSFLIETHSEHLILRLLRRIRESADHCDAEANGERPLTPDALGVNYLSKEGDRVTATLLPVNNEGDFDRPWPRGFFEERGPELF